jgi:hypothetical protein
MQLIDPISYYIIVIPPIGPRVPTFDTHQNEDTFTVCIYTRHPDTRKEDVIAEVDDSGTVFTCVVKFNDEQTVYCLRYLRLPKSSPINVIKEGITNQSQVQIESPGKNED